MHCSTEKRNQQTLYAEFSSSVCLEEVHSKSYRNVQGCPEKYINSPIQRLSLCLCRAASVWKCFTFVFDMFYPQDIWTVFPLVLLRVKEQVQGRINWRQKEMVFSDVGMNGGL